MLVQLNAEQTALYKEQEDANYHTSNIVLLAACCGNFDMLNAALEIFHLWHGNRGITAHLVNKRQKLSEKLTPVFYAGESK